MSINYNGTTYYYVTNLQGDVIAILDHNGLVVVEYTYDAWGKLLTTTGSMASTLGLHNPLRYRGYVYDRETGLYYLHSRYYNPEWGRFINADSQLAAGVFIGSATAFAGSAYIAAISSNSAEEFASYGGSALVNTTIGGFLGGTSAYNAARTSNQSMQHAGESACFIAGTLIRTDNGSVPIEQIAAGDLVWARDEDTGQIELKPVVETYINEADELIHIFVNGEEIITTSEHPFYSPVKGWTEAARLCVGDILVLVNGDYAVVEKVLHETLDIPIPVFNFQVADFHTYHVGSIGILVHNTCGQYSPPKGGGGITDTIQVGDTTVTFGHGRRHLVGTNLTTSQVNPVIANDVVARNLPVGTFFSNRTSFCRRTNYWGSLKTNFRSDGEKFCHKFCVKNRRNTGCLS